MNMPLNEKKEVNFTTTLFALVRTSLKIKTLSQEKEGVEKSLK